MTFKGSSNSMPSWTDADGGAGWINGRKSRQARVMRPRFNAGSIEFAGNKTWASARFDCLISSRSPSGQLSESAAKGTEMAEGSTGTCGAGEGVGANGLFGAPLLRGVMKLVPACRGGGVRCNCRGGGGVMALVAGAGACGMDCLGGGVVTLVAGSTRVRQTKMMAVWSFATGNGGGRRGFGCDGNFDPFAAGAEWSGDVFGDFDLFLGGAA